MVMHEQGSQAWHDWRKTRVTASVVPTIMGNLDFSTPLKEYEKYVGTAKEETTPSFVFQRGHDGEIKAREMFSLLTDKEFRPMCFECEDFPWLGASLDGYCEQDNTLIEIKVPSKIKHEMAENGIVPECYIDQLQTQLLVSGANSAHYISYSDEKGALAIVNVTVDLFRQQQIIEKTKEFWKCVLDKTPPEPTQKDYVEITMREMQDLVIEYKEKSAQSNELKERLDHIKKLLVANMTHPRMSFNGVTINEASRAGSKYHVVKIAK